MPRRAFDKMVAGAYDEELTRLERMKAGDQEDPEMTETCMLYEIEILEARRIAELAAAAREARDQVLTPIAEAELGEPRPARGEHHPAGAFSFAAVPADEPTYQALREAIQGLPSDIRRKLWSVMRTGCGDYARGDWGEALAAADNMSDDSVVSDLAEAVDLHDKLMKGLYEIGAAEPRSPPA
jgi:hypothetical protein